MTKHRFHLHLISDATGETLHALARACLAQFPDSESVEHIWSMVRTRAHLERVLGGIEANPGVALYTIVNSALREPLQECCGRLGLPAIPVLDAAIGALADYLGLPARGQPGQQHTLTPEYFRRMEALNFAMTHDDGQAPWGLPTADVILLGVSRTSKTPTSIYLANRGVKAANVPIVPGVKLPPELFLATKPLIVGLTTDPERLVSLRKTRLTVRQLPYDDIEYLEPEAVRSEITAARRLYAEHNWPVIDVTRRSIEETAAAVLKLIARHTGARPQ